MKLEFDEPSGEYHIEAVGATPPEIRLTCCSSCSVHFCSQMLDEGFARVATPPNGDGEAVAERIRHVIENAKCLKGLTRTKISEASQ